MSINIIARSTEKQTMIIGTCKLEMYLPGMTSLKDKRSVLKSMLARMHNTFNVSAAEVDRHDIWQSAVIGFAVVSNSTTHANQVIDTVISWIESRYPDAVITKQEIEIL